MMDLKQGKQNTRHPGNLASFPAGMHSQDFTNARVSIYCVVITCCKMGCEETAAQILKGWACTGQREENEHERSWQRTQGAQWGQGPGWLCAGGRNKCTTKS